MNTYLKSVQHRCRVPSESQSAEEASREGPQAAAAEAAAEEMEVVEDCNCSLLYCVGNSGRMLSYWDLAPTTRAGSDARRFGIW